MSIKHKGFFLVLALFFCFPFPCAHGRDDSPKEFYCQGLRGQGTIAGEDALVDQGVPSNEIAGPVADGQAGKTGKKASPWKFTLGDWNESRLDSQQRGDFNFIMAMLSYKKLTFRYDYYTPPKDYMRRYWLHYGDIMITDNADFKLGFSPGAMLLNNSRAVTDERFYGGMLTFNFPKMGFKVQQRSYAGDGAKKGIHYTFSDLKVARSLYLSHVYWTYTSDTPASYLGPKVDLKLGGNGGFSAMYGFSVYDRRPDARYFFVTGSLKF